LIDKKSKYFTNAETNLNKIEKALEFKQKSLGLLLRSVLYPVWDICMPSIQ